MTTVKKPETALPLTGKGRRPTVLIEEWLPAAAIGVECMRERGSASALAPHTYLHVWWARRPLTASRAAVLASLLPADFPRDVFERLLGFWGTSKDILEAQRYLDYARATAIQVPNPHGMRAFRRGLQPKDLERAREAIGRTWGNYVTVIDPMAGGGSIPLEAARLGFHTLANEYNPVACSVLEATVDYPFRFGPELAERAEQWGHELRKRFNARMERFFPSPGPLPRHTYIYARTVPCPDTGHETPLVPDWHLLRPRSGRRVAAEPVVNKGDGTWTVRIRDLGSERGQLGTVPMPTYADGKGVSLFTGRQIPADYIKAKAQAGEMGSRLYAVAVKTPHGLEFEAPTDEDVEAIVKTGKALASQRIEWERENVLPTEKRYHGDCDRSYVYGITTWANAFAPRQLFGMGVLVEELRALRPEIEEKEGGERAAAIEHLLAFAIDKLANYNSAFSFWHALRGGMANTFDRHDFSFKATFAEMAVCNAGGGLEWAINNVTDAWKKLANLPRAAGAMPAHFTLGSATALPGISDLSMTAIVVDPPYDDNVQYSELADFFYVWLKRTQGHRHPDWFATYLCEHDEEAVVNVSRHREDDEPAALARQRARAHYRQLMTDTFKECRRILRDEGVLTVMFTHKKQEAWEALFSSLIDAGFMITATWPVKTESEHSLHQARKNAAQSTVILVARKRDPGAGIGFFDRAMKASIRERARGSAERLKGEGLNPVDQLVGSFGPALEVYSAFDEVRTDTGEPVGVDRAIDEASDAVSAWRIEQLAARGLEGVEAEGRFALLCWDVLGAAEFRFNEAKLLGHAVGMDVETLAAAGLVSKEGDKVKILSAKQRRRDRALEPEEHVETLCAAERQGKRRRKADALKLHPNDPAFRTALDGCHALALRYEEAGGGAGGVGSARALARQQAWRSDSPVARLMAALVVAAPDAVRLDRGKKSAAAQFPEFRAWHALLQPLFGLPAPDWTERKPPQIQFELRAEGEEEAAREQDEEDDEENED